MNYCYYIKHNEDIPKQLLNKFNILIEPVLLRGDSQNQNVAQRFVEKIVAVGLNIADMLKPNVPKTLSPADCDNH